MASRSEPLNARVTTQPGDAGLEVVVGGSWRVTDRRPRWADIAGKSPPRGVRLRAENLEAWDTSLLLFLHDAQEWCLARKVPCEFAELPENVRTLLGELGAAHARGKPTERSHSFITAVGLATQGALGGLRDGFQFVGNCVLGVGRTLRRPAKFRWRDCFNQMQACGAMSLPIVGLISFLVGLTLAYQAAEELRQFGADIYVADIVGLSVVREMGPLMVAVILAGRTGAAFAATLGNMKANEEIDALEALGIPAVDFLALPRLLALGLMMPLLTLYANAIGILGGAFVSMTILQIPPSAYWVETQSIVGLTDINAGLLKAIVFGWLVGVVGCLRGFQADRSAEGVGRAATSAVVTSILFIVVADALFAVVYNVFGI